MNKLQRNLKALRRSLSKGFTLIELAIVGLFLGLLAVFAIAQFGGNATDTTRANGMFEAASKLSDNWSTLAQQCGAPTDVTATSLSAGTGATTDKKNLSLLLGNAAPATTPTDYTACYNNSGIRPLSGMSTGAQGAEAIQGLAVTLTNVVVNGRNAMGVQFANVPDNVVLPLINKYSSAAGAATKNTITSTDTDTTDNGIRYGTATGGKRTVTIIRPL